jgi:hypothetical protein
MLQEPPRFYHIPSAYNRLILETYCVCCSRRLGASPYRSVLSIVEMAHRCSRQNGSDVKQMKVA